VAVAGTGEPGEPGEPGGFPRCRACGRGELVPLSDFGPQGAELRYKAWVCTNPACGFAVKIHGGELLRHRGAGAPPAAPGPAPPVEPRPGAGGPERKRVPSPPGAARGGPRRSPE
jgi:hypothetical protein